MDSKEELWGALQHVPYEGLDRVDKVFLIGWCRERFPESRVVVADWCNDDKYAMKLWDGFARTATAELNLNENTVRGMKVIKDCIAAGRHGFVGGLILANALAGALSEAGIHLHTRAARKVLEECGYVRHPALPEGKIKLRGCAVRVYVRRGHPAEQITDVRGYLRQL